jgi:hypothetical protein
MTGIATIAAAVVATMGLHTWKRQLFGNSNYELSRRLLRSAYRLREAIQFVRNPLMLAGEMATARKAAGLGTTPPPGTDDPSVELAYQSRWQKVVDARVEFDAELLEAEALWGPEIRQRADDLFRCIGRLNFSLSQWLDARQRRARGEPLLQHDGGERIMDVMYDSGGGSNKYSDELRAAFERIEATIRPRLKL